MSRFQIGNIRKVELHWYEAHGIGKKKISVAATWLPVPTPSGDNP